MKRATTLGRSDVDPLAQGRVWSATDALQSGLIDSVGSLQDAIVAAANLASIQDYQVDYVEAPLSPKELLMRQLANSVGSLNLWPSSSASAALSGLLRPMRDAVQELASLQDPGHLFVRCIACGVVR